MLINVIVDVWMATFTNVHILQNTFHRMPTSTHTYSKHVPYKGNSYTITKMRTKQIIRYRATTTRRRPQIKQYIASNEGATKLTVTSYNLDKVWSGASDNGFGENHIRDANNYRRKTPKAWGNVLKMASVHKLEHSTLGKLGILQCHNKEWRHPNIGKTSKDPRMIQLELNPSRELSFRLHTTKGISLNLQEQDKSSDIEQQPL